MTILFTGLDPTAFRSFGTLIHRPALQQVPDPRHFRRLPGILDRLRTGLYDGLLFTSKQAVPAFLDAVSAHHLPSRLHFAAEGHQTRRALNRRGVSKVWDAEVDSLGADFVVDRHWLLLPGTHAPGPLRRSWLEAGATLTELPLHRLRTHPTLGATLPEHDAVYFVSPSGVRAWHQVYGDAGFRKPLFTIGAAVSDTVLELTGRPSDIWLPPHLQSTIPTLSPEAQK